MAHTGGVHFFVHGEAVLRHIYWPPAHYSELPQWTALLLGDEGWIESDSQYVLFIRQKKSAFGGVL